LLQQTRSLPLTSLDYWIKKTGRKTFSYRAQYSHCAFNGLPGSWYTTKEAMAKALEVWGHGYKGIECGYKKLLRQLKKNDKGVELNISNSVWIGTDEGKGRIPDGK
jgi:hypothetical protein